MNGVYNRKLFIDTARPARQKLAKMGGIMASSSDLMQAAVPPVQPMAPAPMSMPQPMPQPMMMAPVMPAQPMSMAAPAPMPAQPMVQQTPPPAPMPPIMMNTGGAINEQLRAYSQMGQQMGKDARQGLGQDRFTRPKAVDVSKAPTIEQTEGTVGALGILESLEPGAADAAIKEYGSYEAAEKALSEKGQKIEDLEGEKDEKKVVKGVLDAAEVPDTPDGKKDFARQVFGMEDVSDIAEIDRRIVDVLQGNAVGQGADAFAKATLLGLDVLKKTAETKAALKSGSKMSPLEAEADAVRDVLGKLLAQGIPFNEAMAQAQQFAAQYYATGTPAQGQPTVTPESRLEMVKDALKQKPEQRELILKQAAKDGVNIEGL